ncbi:hypothetical protein CIPAW_11G073800 [Carya illinoinensis]|uniref:Uncharacterized protein n=1 Tax=Carya illinoinensis TaxID=32201 RepID=A0A8T1P1Y5_CARIL|nr:hypothetical protein CIPAW_11G073800 [Carya illinoinensis]
MGGLGWQGVGDEVVKSWWPEVERRGRSEQKPCSLMGLFRLNDGSVAGGILWGGSPDGGEDFGGGGVPHGGRRRSSHGGRRWCDGAEISEKLCGLEELVVANGGSDGGETWWGCSPMRGKENWVGGVGHTAGERWFWAVKATGDRGEKQGWCRDFQPCVAANRKRGRKEEEKERKERKGKREKEKEKRKEMRSNPHSENQKLIRRKRY